VARRGSGEPAERAAVPRSPSYGGRSARPAGTSWSLVRRATCSRWMTPDVDAARFEGFVAEAREAAATGRHDDAARLLREGLRLWRGPTQHGSRSRTVRSPTTRSSPSWRRPALRSSSRRTSPCTSGTAGSSTTGSWSQPSSNGSRCRSCSSTDRAPTRSTGRRCTTSAAGCPTPPRARSLVRGTWVRSSLPRPSTRSSPRSSPGLDPRLTGVSSARLAGTALCGDGGRGQPW
jgi:hypothetical protein